MKKILIVLLSTLCISAFGQNVKLNDRGEIVKVETITTESPISSVSIDRQIEFYKTTIEQFTKKIQELEAVKTEVLILDKNKKNNIKKINYGF